MNTLSIDQRNDLIISHIYLADKLAKSKKKKLSHVSYEELQSAAYLGLTEAAKNYSPSNNDCFAAFAVWRIAGAIQDYLRELSWGTRANPQKMSCLLFDDISQKDMLQENLEMFDFLIKNLSDFLKKILKFYYLEDKKISEIGLITGLHQSRISQILSEAKIKLYDEWVDKKTELFCLISC